MTFDIIRKNNSLLVAVAGKLDAETAPMLDDALAAEFENVLDVVFDLAELEYISSAGLRTLLATYKRMVKAGSSMRIRNVGASVMEVFKVSGFADLYDIE